MKKRPKPATQTRVIPGGPVIGLGHVPVSPHKPPHRHHHRHQKPVAKKKHHVRRKLALGEAVACCAAEALAASLRLAGWPVSDADVLALYELTAGGPDEGATISETLEAASEFGLGGLRLHDFGELAEHAVDLLMPADVLGLIVDHDGGIAGDGDESAASLTRPEGQLHGRTLILGVDLPGPHALCDDGAAWWSWGRPYDPAEFPQAVIEEAWQVTWPPR